MAASKEHLCCAVCVIRVSLVSKACRPCQKLGPHVQSGRRRRRPPRLPLSPRSALCSALSSQAAWWLPAAGWSAREGRREEECRKQIKGYQDAQQVWGPSLEWEMRQAGRAGSERGRLSYGSTWRGSREGFLD